MPPIFRPHLLAAAVVLSTPPALAQVAQLSWSNGILGEQVDYVLSGDPFQSYTLIPSLSPGPTPLSILDPQDDRELCVGIELGQFWTYGALDASGQALLTYAAAISPSLLGTPVYSQFVTWPGNPTKIDEISNPVSWVLGLAGDVTPAVGERQGPIEGHASTTLVDGRVLLSGGFELAAATTLDTFELFEPQTQTFVPGVGTMQHPRSEHSGTLLADGRVLLFGGVDDTGAVVASGDLWDPATGLAVPIAPMSTPRVLHTATLLSDGRVFVAGGVTYFDPADVFFTLDTALSSTEIYDPATDSWQPGPTLTERLAHHAASLLASGDVLITGGIEADSLFGFPVLDWTDACVRYDPVADALVPTAPLLVERARHAQLTLPDGRAVVTGGEHTVGFELEVLADCESYDETSDAWTVEASLNGPRSRHELVDTGTDLVLLGGISDYDATVPMEIPDTTIEVASHTLMSWSAPTQLLETRPRGTASVFDAGLRVLVTGSPDSGLGGSVEIFVP
ncbi:MAG: hypothetical protein O7B99_15475 [Planctomycetota bacterium]|nr:hypothetical protein [Planctomycetota bacterium]